MDKKIILLPLLLLMQLVSAQEVKFTEGQYQNGLIYPIAQIKTNPDAEKTLNNNILEVISKYEDQDYCIGQYGYVQQTNYIQLHFYFNCIDLDESQNEFHLFDVGSGEPCQTSDMFLDKQKKRYRPFFRERISEHYKENGKEAPSEAYMEDLSIDDCTVEFLEKGLQISLPTDENWPEKDLIILWSEVQSFLKTTFI